VLRKVRVFAYCCQSFRDTTKRGAGVEPVTCPPVVSASFNPSWMMGADLLYFDLHGGPGDSAWYGDDGRVALTAAQLRAIRFPNEPVVFAMNCFLADKDSPMLDALLGAGAAYIVAGDGKNYAGEKALYGAALLGLWFRRLLRVTNPLKAIALAKRRVRADLFKDRVLRRFGRAKAAKDTLAFRAYHREETA